MKKIALFFPFVPTSRALLATAALIAFTVFAAAAEASPEAPPAAAVPEASAPPAIPEAAAPPAVPVTREDPAPIVAGAAIPEAKPADEKLPEMLNGGEPIQETADQGGGSDAAKAEAAKTPVETPEEAAARAEAEHKVKREQERIEIMKEAEQFIETADEKIMTALPYPLNLLFGVRLFNITLWRYLASAGLILLAFFLIILVVRRFNKTKRAIDSQETLSRWQMIRNVALLALRNPVKLFIVGILLRGVSSLVVTVYHPDIVWFSSLLMFLGAVLYFFDMVGIIDREYGDRIFHSSDRLMETVRPILVKAVRFIILFIAGMQIYQSITGQPMVSLLAGLGIGGLALALASQETLQNLLGFAAIAMDKAFLVGDAVSIAAYDGTVEHVGLRSTRLRAYDGSSIVIPNSSAINSNIVNRNRRPFIRREIRIALSPLNSYDKMSQALDLVREAADLHEGKVSGLPPVVRFIDYEPARFIVQVLFWYDAEKPFFFDECSRVNLEILKRLSEAGILFAER